MKDCFLKKRVIVFIVFGWIMLFPLSVDAQFLEPMIVKIEHSQRLNFKKELSYRVLTGEGFYRSIMPIDTLAASEIRGRFQTLFGNPTQTLLDLVYSDDFTLRQAIQYEYWFLVDDSIRVIVVDADGPFQRGVSYAADERYIDFIPGIKRELNRLVMSVDKIDSFEDIFYSPELEKWFRVYAEDGKSGFEEIPPKMGTKIDTYKQY